MPRDGFRYELVEGELRRMPPPGFRHGRIAGRLGASVLAYVEERGLGAVLAAETGFLLRRNPDTVRAPDASFVSGERLRSTPFSPDGYFPGAPDLAVEVLSPSDTYAEVEEKVAMWLSYGTRIVLVLDPAKEVAVVHGPSRQITILRAGQTLTAEDVVPGWHLDLGDLFRAD